MVPELIAITLNLAERATFLVCFMTKELHIFDEIGVAKGEVFVILVWHCVEGAKICAMFGLTKSELNYKFRLLFKITRTQTPNTTLTHM